MNAPDIARPADAIPATIGTAFEGGYYAGQTDKRLTQSSAAPALLVTTTKDAGRRPLQRRVRPGPEARE